MNATHPLHPGVVALDWTKMGEDTHAPILIVLHGLTGGSKVRGGSEERRVRQRVIEDTPIFIVLHGLPGAPKSARERGSRRNVYISGVRALG